MIMDGRRLARAVLNGGAAALLWGVAAGLAARLVMRLIAEVTSTATSFSVSGTALIVTFFVALPLPGAVAMAWSRDRWPWLVLGAGVVLLAVQAVGIGSSDLGVTHHLTAVDWVLIGLLLTAMAGVIAAQGVLVARTARRWAPAESCEPALTAA
jgi:hypothetical protein